MDARALLTDIRNHGIALQIDANNLVASPASLLTVGHRAAIRRLKPELMLLLAANDAIPPDPLVTPCAQCRYFWPGIVAGRGHCAPRYRTVADTETCKHFTARRVGEWTQSTEVTA